MSLSDFDLLGEHKDKKISYNIITKKFPIDIGETYDILHMQKMIMQYFIENDKNIRPVLIKIKTVLDKHIAKNKNLIPEYDIQKFIVGKDGIKAIIHDIHNFLRNNGAGYGMNALKIFNLLYGLKIIEFYNLFDKMKLSDICRFSNLLNIVMEYEETKDPKLLDELAILILRDILDELYDNKNIKKFLFYHLSNSLSGKIFKYVILQIEKIYRIDNEQLSGKIYEYFIGRDNTAISELGAYFTNRYIVNFIYDEVKPYVIDEVPTMIDMFGGSGGFTLGYIDYINKYAAENNINVNWRRDAKNVYHYDMNEDVVKYQALEAFCMTGELPNISTMGSTNSFTYDFPEIDIDGRKMDEHMKFDYIFTNPPYGGDSNKKSEECLKLEKIQNKLKEILKQKYDSTKEHQSEVIKDELKKMANKRSSTKVSIKNNTTGRLIKDYAKKYNLTANDKESCSLILMMLLLKDRGIATGVLKSGLFFSQKYKKLRKHLIENYNVKQVIDIPSDQFENTKVSTKILIFTTGYTKKVKFSELRVNTWDDVWEEDNDGFLVLKHAKGDIKNLEKKIIVTATIDEIINKQTISNSGGTEKINYYYKLNSNEYTTYEIIPNDGYVLEYIKNICEVSKSNRPASFGKSTGKYNFYKSSKNILKCDTADHNEKSIIIGTGGKFNIFIDDKFSASNHTLVLTSKYVNVLYILFKSMPELILKGMTGSTGLTNISNDYILNLKVPIPDDSNFEYWDNYISQDTENIVNYKDYAVKKIKQ